MSEPNEPLLVSRDLAKAYPSGGGVLQVLAGCSLDVGEGESIAIIGPSGIGKSTLLHLLAGLDRSDAGSIRFRDRALGDMAEAELAAYRSRHVGMVFQFYHLLPEFTALENVMMPLLIGREPDEAADRAAALLAETGLEGRAHHYPAELSGGERQRVAIARALVREPDLVLADEPTGNLDQETGERVMAMFLRLWEKHRTALVLVTHNPDLVVGFDRVLTMQPGGVLEGNGSPDAADRTVP